MNISVNIPSYRRPVVETLRIFPFCKVWVCETEADDYRVANRGAEIVACKKGIQGNLCRIRNHILDTEFAAGADAVIILDDDFQGIARFDVNRKSGFGYERTQIGADDFFPFAEKYSRLCGEWGFKMWGLNVNSDAMAYRHYSPFSTRSYIGGPFQAFLNNPLRYDERIPLKEDYDMTLQHCNKYRGALRLNAYHYNVRQSENKGGCATMRNYLKEKEQFELLAKKWGRRIVREDRQNLGKKQKRQLDYNPIINIPIRGI